jgi:deazaflavin-dependent oxidoreductase (nitroreductase family)
MSTRHSSPANDRPGAAKPELLTREEGFEDGPTPLVDLIEGQSRQRRIGALLGSLVGARGIGRPFARLARSPMLVRPVTTRITRFHAWLLRLSRGRLRRSWLFAAGQPVLSLTTTGRTSGLPRTTTVACFRCGDTLALAAMNLGSPRDPDWALNLQVRPDATIVVAARSIEVTARRAVGEEASRLWQRWVELQPSAELFRELAGREIPLFVIGRRGHPA